MPKSFAMVQLYAQNKRILKTVWPWSAWKISCHTGNWNWLPRKERTHPPMRQAAPHRRANRHKGDSVTHKLTDWLPHSLTKRLADWLTGWLLSHHNVVECWVRKCVLSAPTAATTSSIKYKIQFSSITKTNTNTKTMEKKYKWQRNMKGVNRNEQSAKCNVARF